MIVSKILITLSLASLLLNNCCVLEDLAPFRFRTVTWMKCSKNGDQGLPAFRVVSTGGDLAVLLFPNYRGFDGRRCTTGGIPARHHVLYDAWFYKSTC